MAKEFSYFRGIIGASTTNTLIEPSATSAGDANRGALLTTNAQYMRTAKGTAPQPTITATMYPASWSHPADTVYSTYQTTGTITVSTAPSGGSTGRWVWIIREVTNFYSDFQMYDFSFNSSITDPANTSAGLNAVFDGHSHDSGLDDIDTDTDAKIKSVYETKINLQDSDPFNGIATTTSNSRWNTWTGDTPSSSTGLSAGTGVYYVYYEASGSFTGGNNSFVRTSEMTYTGSPTCSFAYAAYTTTANASSMGEVLLYWVVES